MNFSDRVLSHYAVAAEEGDMQPGSAHPDNWQKTMQSGYTPDQMREHAKQINDVLHSWQDDALRVFDSYDALTFGVGSNNLERFNPLLIKGLSRAKLDKLAEICTKLGTMVTIA